MLAPYKSDKNFRSLSNPELFELVLAIKELSQLVVTAHEGEANCVVGTSVVIQESESKQGQSDVNHLRIHIVPRRKNDSSTNEEIRVRLENFAQS